MRPVDKGAPPARYTGDGYTKARGNLLERIGPYCSYCERRLAHDVEVDHVQPKNPKNRSNQIPAPDAWENLLLACKNCNARKSNKPINPNKILLPDRDNTAYAFMYGQDGQVFPNPKLPSDISRMAQALIDLVGLNAGFKKGKVKQSNLEGWAQRREVWLIAEDALDDLRMIPQHRMRRRILSEAVGRGCFSIWMSVFRQDLHGKSLLCQLIAAFPGTATNCFDGVGLPVAAQRPPNGLPGAGKA